MSPEQAEGRAVDQRSDIFSLGVLFYEMAVGERPFKGDTSLSVLSAILRDTPTPLLEVNPSLPRELARVVRRCLAKDSDDRYQSAADLRSDLDDLRQASYAGELRLPASIPAPSKAPSSRLALAAGLALAVLGGLAGVAWRGSSVSVAPTAPRMTFSRLTLLDGVAQQPMISPDEWLPDGRRLLINRQGRVYAIDVETGAQSEVLAIDGEVVGTARLSPDRNWLYFLHGSASGDIWLVRFDHGSATDAGRSGR